MVKTLKNKKLNNTLFENNINIHNKEMTDLMKIEQSNNVSNKEALRDKIHEIHNYLRNNGAGYGMNALKVFNLLYGLKKIEEKNLLDKVNLKRPECEFSYLLKIANENKLNEKLAELIFGDVLTYIKKSDICDLLFYEIPTNMKSSVFTYLIKEINNITIIEKTCNVLLSGKIYEYFIGRDESAISELGAYFTDRHIVDYIYGKLNPEINEDGSINSMIDMFGGSGGFTTGYINYLNNKYDINWKDNINKIYHYDMNEDVVKSAGLEFFCLTGELPNMDNLGYKNSFTDNFDNKKFMNVITNPPYGGDKVVQSETQLKRKKIKEYIKKELLSLKDELIIKTRNKQLKMIEEQEKKEKINSNKTKVSVEMSSNRINKFAKDNNLSGNDKESSSLILIMDMVDVNGTAIGVLKEGVFFNKTYKNIRKCLVEKFNVREIISVPQDQFENTSTKTSIVIFDTIEKTSNVRFSELIVEKYTEDKFEEIDNEIALIESKGDIYGIVDKLISEATKEEILNNTIYSLNGKEYNKKEIVVGEGYELVKLGDICEFLPKSKRNASFGQQVGKYNFYTSSDKVQKCDSVDYLEECLIIGSGGVANIKIDNIFSCSGDNIILKASNNRYLYNLIKGNMNLLSDGFTGSTLKHLSKDYLINLKVPIPKSKHKITEWVDKISKPYDKKNKNQELIMKLEEDIKNKIKDIEENEECDEVELGSICDIVSGSKTNLQQYLVKNSSHKIIRTRNLIDSNDYLYLNDEGINKCKTKILNKGDILMSTFADSYICKIIPENFIGSTYNGGLFKINNLKISLTYFINYIMMDNFKEQIKKISGGSTVLLFNIDNLKKLKIKIPKNKKLIKNFEPLFNEIEKLQIELKEAELEYTQLINELSEEAIPTNKIKDSTEKIKIQLNDEPVIKEKKSKTTDKKVKSQINTI